MEFNKIIRESAISPALKAEIVEFNDLCFKLLSMTEKENETLFGMFFAKHVNTWQGKLNLLAEFEKKVNHICNLLENEKLFDTRVLSHMFDCIERLECKIKVNASLHFHNYVQMTTQPGMAQEAYSSCH